MSVLETFYYLFDADAQKLQTGIQQADDKVNQLHQSLDSVDKKAGMVGGTFLELAQRATIALSGILSFAALTAATVQVTNFTKALDESSEALGVNISDLHAYDNAATHSGANTGDFIKSLTDLQHNLKDVSENGGDLADVFKKLGLNAAGVKAGVKDPIAAIDAMADSFAKLSKADRADLGGKIGLDAGTIEMLSQGKQGVLDLVAAQRALGVITKDQMELNRKYEDRLKKLHEALGDMGRQYEDVKRQIVFAFLPAVTWVMEKVTAMANYLIDHKALVISFFTVLGIATLAYAADAAIAAIATWAFLLPWIAIGAAILLVAAAIAVIAEDVYAFIKGNDSLLGEFVAKWPLLAEVIKQMGYQLGVLADVADAVFSVISALITDGPQAAIETLIDKIVELVNRISQNFPIVGRVFDAVTDGMSIAAKGIEKAFDLVTAAVQKSWAIIKGIFEGAKTVLGWFSKIPGFSYLEEFGKKEREAAVNIPVNLFKQGTAAAAAALDRSVPNRTADERAQHTRELAGLKGMAPIGHAPKATAAALGVVPPGKKGTNKAYLDTGSANIIPIVHVIPSKTISKSAQDAIDAARKMHPQTVSPILSKSASALGKSGTTNQTVSKATTVTIQKIDVNTQATDGEGVSKALSSHLGGQLRSAIDQHDNGVKI